MLQTEHNKISSQITKNYLSNFAAQNSLKYIFLRNKNYLKGQKSVNSQQQLHHLLQFIVFGYLQANTKLKMYLLTHFCLYTLQNQAQSDTFSAQMACVFKIGL